MILLLSHLLLFPPSLFSIINSLLFSIFCHIFLLLLKFISFTLCSFFSFLSQPFQDVLLQYSFSFPFIPHLHSYRLQELLSTTYSTPISYSSQSFPLSLCANLLKMFWSFKFLCLPSLSMFVSLLPHVYTFRDYYFLFYTTSFS